MRMRAAVLEEFGRPLVVQEVELAEPRAGEALVRLTACGVCHTDLFTASGAPHRLGGSGAPPCSLRSPPLPPYISNVAVPGATVFDPVHAGPTPSANARRSSSTDLLLPWK